MRVAFTLAAVASIALGLAVHRGLLPLPPAARDVAGDALWAAMIAWWIGAAAPRATVRRRAIGGLAVCFAVELGQLVHRPALDALRRTTLGRLTLGSDFDPRDLLAYALGVLAAATIEAGLRAASGPRPR